MSKRHVITALTMACYQRRDLRVGEVIRLALSGKHLDRISDEELEACFRRLGERNAG